MVIRANALGPYSADPGDRRLVLRWFADMLAIGIPYTDAQLGKRGWSYLYGDVATPKQLLLDAGLIEAVEGGVAKYGMNML